MWTYLRLSSAFTFEVLLNGLRYSLFSLAAAMYVLIFRLNRSGKSIHWTSDKNKRFSTSLHSFSLSFTQFSFVAQTYTYFVATIFFQCITHFMFSTLRFFVLQFFHPFVQLMSVLTKSLSSLRAKKRQSGWLVDWSTCMVIFVTIYYDYGLQSECVSCLILPLKHCHVWHIDCFIKKKQMDEKVA